VEYDENDRYGRILGKVLLDGDDMNLEQIRPGLAWRYKK
jgi:endonuclease YncB( thermonuclease family)